MQTLTSKAKIFPNVLQLSKCAHKGIWTFAARNIHTKMSSRPKKQNILLFELRTYTK